VAQVVTAFGQDRFGVELYALDVINIVLDTHDFMLAFPLAPGHHGQAFGDRIRLQGQRMVARGLERLWQVFEHPLAAVVDHGCFPMHDPLRPDHLGAENLADTLVTQANAKHGDAGTQGAHHVQADTRLVRRARPGRNHDSLRLHFCNFIDRYRVVAHGFHFRPQFTQVLHQVVSEGVIVVDHEDHG
jgi:hypothetical protein